MDKICSDCGTKKQVTEFRDRSNQCKACYNAQRRDTRDVRPEKTNDSSAMRAMMTKLKETQTFMMNCTKNGYDPKLLELISDLNVIAQKIKSDGRLLWFIAPVSDVMNDYIKKAFMLGHTLQSALSVLKSTDLNDDFREHFGVDKSVLLTKVDELEILELLRAALQIGYDVLVEDFNAYTIDTLKSNDVLTAPVAKYNTMDKTFYLSQNPLNLTASDFISKVKALEHIGVKYYTVTKYWDKLIVPAAKK